MSVKPIGALAVPFLGGLASLQLIDPIVANTALVKAALLLAITGNGIAMAAPNAVLFLNSPSLDSREHRSIHEAGNSHAFTCCLNGF